MRRCKGKEIMHGEGVDDACRELHQLEPRGRLFGFFVCAWSVSHPSQLIIAGTARLTSCVSSSLSGLSSGLRCTGSGFRMGFRLRLCLASRGLRHLEGRGSGRHTFGLRLSGLVGGCIMAWSVSGREELRDSRRTYQGCSQQEQQRLQGSPRQSSSS